MAAGLSPLSCCRLHEVLFARRALQVAVEAAHPVPTHWNALQVPGNGAGHLELKCTFNNPDTETKVTPAGLDAPPQPAAATEHVPDEPDSQIAADLELDSFSAGDAAPEEQVCLLSADPPGCCSSA